MINGNAIAFIDKLSYEDHYVIFNEKKYYINGCQTKKDANGNIVQVRLEVYNLSDGTTLFSVSKNSVSDCLIAFQEARIWDFRSFWEAEIEWVDE